MLLIHLLQKVINPDVIGFNFPLLCTSDVFTLSSTVEVYVRFSVHPWQPSVNFTVTSRSHPTPEKKKSPMSAELSEEALRSDSG